VGGVEQTQTRERREEGEKRVRKPLSYPKDKPLVADGVLNNLNGISHCCCCVVLVVVGCCWLLLVVVVVVVVLLCCCVVLVCCVVLLCWLLCCVVLLCCCVVLLCWFFVYQHKEPELPASSKRVFGDLKQKKRRKKKTTKRKRKGRLLRGIVFALATHTTQQLERTTLRRSLLKTTHLILRSTHKQKRFTHHTQTFIQHNTTH